MSSKRLLVCLAVVVLAALGQWIRFEHRTALAEVDPLLEAELLDSGAYADDARAMRAGGPLEPALSYRPPGYPLLLAALVDEDEGRAGAARVQAGLDALTTLLVALLAHLLFARAGATVAAAGLFALSPTAIQFHAERLETSLMLMLVAAHLVALVLAVQREERAWPRWVAVGVTLGLSALVRPNALLWLPVLAVAAWRARGRSAALAAALACMAVVAPVTIKNVVRGGEFVVVSANGGPNLYLGNVPDDELHASVPYYAHLPGPVSGWAWERLGRRAFVDGAERSGEASTWHAQRALSEMASHPLRSAKLLALKSVALLNGYELSNNRDLHREGSALAHPLARYLGWGVLLPLAVVAWLRSRDADAARRWVGAFAATFAVSVVLFFVCERHRAPALPALIPFAALGLVELPTLFRPLRHGAVFAVLGVAFFANVDWFGHARLYRDYSIDPVGEGDFLVYVDAKQARERYELALARNERDSLAMCNLGSLAIGERAYGEAERLLFDSIQFDDQRVEAWNNYALVLHLVGRNEDAIGAIDRALTMGPGYSIAWANRGRILVALERWKDARETLAHALSVLGGTSIEANVRALLAQVDAELAKR